MKTNMMITLVQNVPKRNIVMVGKDNFVVLYVTTITRILGVTTVTAWIYKEVYT